MDRKIPFIWTNDDIGVGRAGNLLRMIEFLNHFQVKGSFAIVPISLNNNERREIYEDSELCKVCEKAMSDGHMLFQHSVTHSCVENGIADIRMYARHLMGYDAACEHSRIGCIMRDIGIKMQLWRR